MKCYAMRCVVCYLTLRWFLRDCVIEPFIYDSSLVTRRRVAKESK